MKRKTDSLDLLKKLEAESLLMNCIRRIVTLTSYVRSEDILEIANILDKKLLELSYQIEKRNENKDEIQFREKRFDKLA